MTVRESKWTRSDHQREGMHLHETTKSYNHVVQAWITKKLLSAIFDLHKWNLRMLVTIVDGKEDEFLDSHGLCTLYKSDFSFPVYLKGKSLTELVFPQSYTSYCTVCKHLTVFMGSSGRPVAQSIIVCMPTNVAGMVSGLLKSACSKNSSQYVIFNIQPIYLFFISLFHFHQH